MSRRGLCRRNYRTEVEHQLEFSNISKFDVMTNLMAQCLGLKSSQSLIVALGVCDISSLGKAPQITRFAAEKTIATYRVFDLRELDLKSVPPTMAASLPHSRCPGGCFSAGKTESSFLAGDRHDLTVFVSDYVILAGMCEVSVLRKPDTGALVKSRSLGERGTNHECCSAHRPDRVGCGAARNSPPRLVANRNAQKSSVWLGMTKMFSQHGCLASLELFLSR